MRRVANPREIISSYYESEGFYEVEWSEEALTPGLGVMILSDGRHEIAVNILGEEDVRSRGDLQEALIESEKMLDRYPGVVLAVPRRLSPAIDETVLIKYGIGLVIYDNMGAMEVISPHIRERKPGKMKTEHNKMHNIEGEEIVRLRSELSRILRILEEMEARMDRLEKEQRLMAQKLRNIKNVEESAPKIVEEKPKITESSSGSGDLPSYLKDNPWVSILSKRDRS